MSKVYLYCDKASLNEATLYYVDIVKKGLDAALGAYDYKIVHSLGDIKSPDCIFTITFHYFCKAKIRFPYAKTVCWFQGVGLEEAKMNRPKWKWPLFRLEEWYTVHKADYILFVSEQMKRYYVQYYGYTGTNFSIMPCYNLQQSNIFDVKQYEKPSFAYAGGISPWQSVDVLLDVYAIIEKEIPQSTLTLFCKESPEITQMIAERGIKNCSIRFVPLDQLQDELHKYKYGFILREKNWVNLVATPTKMNSYLASYMIPIYSDGVDDFVKNIDLLDFTICAVTPLNPKTIAEKIVEFEKNSHDYGRYKSIVDTVFDNHFNDAKYIQMISIDASKALNK